VINECEHVGDNRLQFRKIGHATGFILLLAFHHDIHTIRVPMELFAFSRMPGERMRRVKMGGDPEFHC
jgi:hypothetical protein